MKLISRGAAVLLLLVLALAALWGWGQLRRLEGQRDAALERAKKAAADSAALADSAHERLRRADSVWRDSATALERKARRAASRARQWHDSASASAARVLLALPDTLRTRIGQEVIAPYERAIAALSEDTAALRAKLRITETERDSAFAALSVTRAALRAQQSLAEKLDRELNPPLLDRLIGGAGSLARDGITCAALWAARKEAGEGCAAHALIVRAL